MIDRTISIPILPASFLHLTADAANTVEINLASIFSGLAVFDEVLSGSVGTYGYIESGEAVSIDENVSDGAAIRMSTVSVTVTGSPDVILTGDGWTVSNLVQGGTVTGKVATHDVATIVSARELLSTLHISSLAVGAFEAAITISAVGISGIQYYGTGSVALLYRDGCTWQVLQSVTTTWTDVNGKTFTQLQELKKQDMPTG